MLTPWAISCMACGMVLLLLCLRRLRRHCWMELLTKLPPQRVSPLSTRTSMSLGLTSATRSTLPPPPATWTSRLYTPHSFVRSMFVEQWSSWFHSSRVNVHFVRMSASWLRVSTHVTWIIGSRLILSSNQSSATLRVLDTCLVVGLPSLMIILITASLSSKICNIALWWDSSAFGVT